MSCCETQLHSVRDELAKGYFYSGYVSVQGWQGLCSTSLSQETEQLP